ncbi:MAG: HU family DNA-binding protein [Oscillospiraceae bacterium]|jgi:DNA-binding protein HU-beta|nr:HU family DNA-binding protein [Oscillospiraceae bacterium]
MNKAELTNAVSEKTGLTKKDSDAAITAVFDVIGNALSTGDKIQLVGFGSFEVKQREARVGRNPKTRESISIPASKSPVFKAGKALKESVNK